MSEPAKAGEFRFSDAGVRLFVTLITYVISKENVLMLYTRTGTPGAGKSYNMTQDIISFLKSGHYVITNIPLVYGEVARLSKISTSDLMQRLFVLENEEITPSYLYTFSIV